MYGVCTLLSIYNLLAASMILIFMFHICCKHMKANFNFNKAYAYVVMVCGAVNVSLIADWLTAS